MEREFYSYLKQYEAYHWWYRGREKIFEIVISELPRLIKEAFILDEGVGGGRLTSSFAQFGQVVGVDSSIEVVTSLEHSFPFLFVQADAKCLPFGKNTFQLVLMLDVLEHVEDHRRALQEAYDVIKDFGYLVISVPAYQFLWGIQDILSNHKRRYTATEVRQLVQESGFLIRRITYFNALLFPIIALVRLCRQGKLNKTPMLEASQSDFALTRPGFLNELLFKIFSAERWWLKRANFAFGTSILCIAQKGLTKPKP